MSPGVIVGSRGLCALVNSVVESFFPDLPPLQIQADTENGTIIHSRP
jgi:hypothetical protein